MTPKQAKDTLIRIERKAKKITGFNAEDWVGIQAAIRHLTEYIDRMEFGMKTLNKATIKGYVGCDKDGTLRFCHHKPKRMNEIEQTWWSSCDADFDIWNHNLRELFKDLTWDDEPVEVELTITIKPNKCAGCNNVKGCITCTDGDQYAHITERS